jgi:tellurite resistance protein
MDAKVKENRSNSKYNPALDKFENSDLFKLQTELIAKKFESRNLITEIEAIKAKERITKP